MNNVSSHTDEWTPPPLDIPPQWEQIDFEDAFENISLSRFKVPQKEYLSSGMIPIVDQGVSLIGGYTNEASKGIQPNGALIVFGDHTQCFKLIEFRFAPGADGVKVLKPITINERFAYYACRALRLPNRGYSRHYAFLKKSKLPLAPLVEQRRIVAKIEELFSELDKGIESLNTARIQLATYRQAVLKHAFEGKLTAQWRSENKDKLETREQLLARIKQERASRYEMQLQEWKTTVKMWEESGKAGKKPPRPKKPLEIADVPHDVIAKLPQLPESWVWRKLGSLTCGVKYGTAAKSAKAGTAPVLRMGNIQNAKFDWADLVYTSDDDELSEYLLHDGDVLFNRTNSPELVGKTAIYRGERRAIFAGYLIRVNHIRSVADSQYVNLFLNSHVARKYGNSVKTDGVNQSNINGTKLSNYPFPCCSIEEQREVTSILEKTLSLVDETEAGISQELQKADALRQSVLKKAFAGQLVAQDLSDEPASVLLDRIKAVKDQARKNGETTEKTRTMRTVV